MKATRMDEEAARVWWGGTDLNGAIHPKTAYLAGLLAERERAARVVESFASPDAITGTFHIIATQIRQGP